MNNKPKVVNIYVFVDSKDTPTDEKILYSIREYLKNEPKEELGKAPSFNGEIVIKRSERGKPYVEGDLGIGISVSHSGSVFVCGVSKGEIGLDIELPKILGNESDEEMKKRLLGISRRFFNPEEAEYVSKHPLSHFYKVWTAKESFVKLKGQGIDETFSHNSVIPENKNLMNIYNNEECRWNTDGVYYLQRRYKENYELCVCSNEEFTVSIINIDEKI